MLLPDPEGPTSAVEVPGAESKDTSLRTGTPSWYSNETSRNSTWPTIAGSGSLAASSWSSGVSSRISRIRSRPANASVIWLPIETTWMMGPTSSPRYSVKEKNEPSVIRCAMTSCEPTHMIATPTAPRRSVENAETAAKPVIVFATLRKRRWTPCEKTSASRRSARYAFTTRMPEIDSVSRPDTSALIFERSRKSGRSVRIA